MASRRPVSLLLTSVCRAVEAQLAATSSHLHGPSQLTSLYAEVLRPRQFTSLRNFGTTGAPALDGTIAAAEVTFAYILCAAPERSSPEEVALMMPCYLGSSFQSS